MNVEIDFFRLEHAGTFAELNREWLETYHLMESAEEERHRARSRAPITPGAIVDPGVPQVSGDTLASPGLPATGATL